MSRSLIQMLVIMLVMLTVGKDALACSCKRTSTIEVAYLDKYSLTKLAVKKQSLKEKISQYITTTQPKTAFDVTVLENIKGTYSHMTIEAEANSGFGGCGQDIEGKEIYVIQTIDANGKWTNNAHVCNIVGEKFAETVKENIEHPSEDFNSVDTKGWIKFESIKNQSFFVNAKHVEKDELGSMIWVLMNDHNNDSRIKSKKIKLHIACHRKLFSIDHEIHFSEQNAKGKPLYTSRDGGSEQFMWHQLTKQYEQLMRYAC